MGAACCGATSGNDPEIEKATSLNEIIKILKVRAERFPKEKIEIEEYLSDKSKEITSFNSKGITDEALKLRVPYLNILKETFSAVENILSNHPKLPLKETKSYVSEITKLYSITYDPNGDLDKAVRRFKEFVAKY